MIARFYYYWRFFVRRDNDAPWLKGQIEELRRWYPEDADECILNTYARLRKKGGHRLEREAKRILRKQQNKVGGAGLVHLLRPSSTATGKGIAINAKQS